MGQRGARSVALSRRHRYGERANRDRPGVPAPAPRTSGRRGVRLHQTELRPAVDPRRPDRPDPAVRSTRSRPRTRSCRPTTPRRSSRQSVCSQAPNAAPSISASTAHDGALTGRSTSCGPGLRRIPTCRWSFKCRGGTASRTWPAWMEGFAEFVMSDHSTQLVLAGPVVSAVSDDPEGAQVLTRVLGSLASASPSCSVADRLGCAFQWPISKRTPWIVNALQRHATIVVQKSLAEGFGLTVSEAMFKRRPVVASAVGGIADQIVDRELGHPASRSNRPARLRRRDRWPHRGPRAPVVVGRAGSGPSGGSFPPRHSVGAVGVRSCPPFSPEPAPRRDSDGISFA